VAVFDLIERLPGNEHRHDDGLSGAGRHLEGHARQAGIRRVVGGPQIVVDPGVSVLSRHFSNVDGGFGGLDLTEEQRLVAARTRPVREEPRRHAGDADITALPPRVHALPDSIDHRVGLDPVVRPLGFELKLLALLLRAWNRYEMGAGPAAGQNLVGDAFGAKLEMTGGFDERRVENRIVDDDLSHIRS